MELARVLACVGLASGLSLAANVTSAADKKCVLQQVGELNVSDTPRGAIVATTVRGQDARFLLDSGSEVSAMFGPAAERLGLRGFTSKVQLYGVGGNAGAQEVTVPDWRVGTLTAKSVNLILLPTTEKSSIDGLIGAGLLLNQDVEFDLKNGKVRLFKPRGCTGDEVVYWRQPYAMGPIETPRDYAGLAVFVTVRLNGVPLRAMIDSGSSRTLVDAATAARAGLKPIVGSNQSGHGIGPKDLPSQVERFDSFAFDEEVIHNSQILAADIFGAEKVTRTGSRFAHGVSDNEPQMLLGYDFLRSHRVYISMSQRKVYVSYVGGPVFDISTQQKSPTAPDPSPK